MDTFNFKGELTVTDRVFVMGILNLTEDSFYDGGRYSNPNKALEHAKSLLNEGADIVDLGAASSRPGAVEISVQEEIDRLLPLVEKISSELDILISVDTYNSQVAKTAIEAGAHMINDISAGDDDPKMLSTVAALNVPYIAMHKQGKPKDMQRNPNYNKVHIDVYNYLQNKLIECREAGIIDVILDPGFGFGKTLDHNYELLANLSLFQMLEAPLLVGLSRKSMVYKPLDSSSDEALLGTQFLHAFALQAGASILRVHDVKECLDSIKLWTKIREFQ